MAGETNLQQLLKALKPELNKGLYVFVSLPHLQIADLKRILFFFRETEGVTVVVTKEYADDKQWPYAFIASWITLTVHSALHAVGLTAAFSTALTKEGISCNVIAGYYHDHIFVAATDAAKAMSTLQQLST